jgi:hypothetical protein
MRNMYAIGPRAKLGFRVTSVLVNITYILTLINFSFVQKLVKSSKKKNFILYIIIRLISHIP